MFFFLPGPVSKTQKGYKQCSFEVTKPTGLKRCHRPVKVEKGKEDGYCGRHQKRQKLERDPIDTVNNKACLNTLFTFTKMTFRTSYQDFQTYKASKIGRLLQ